MLRRILPVLVLQDTWPEMAHHSAVRIKTDSKLPAYPEALACLEEGIITRGNARNEAYARDLIDIAGTIPPLALDPQTSGGLVLALDQEEAAQLSSRPMKPVMNFGP